MRRRNFIAAACAVTVTGCLGGGYNAEAVKSEAEQVPYGEMTEGDRVHVERGRVRQIQASDDSIYFVQTERQDGEWTNDIYGTWDGEAFSEGDTVELWGVVEGEIDTDSGSALPEVTIVDMQSAE